MTLPVHTAHWLHQIGCHIIRHPTSKPTIYIPTLVTCLLSSDREEERSPVPSSPGARPPAAAPCRLARWGPWLQRVSLFTWYCERGCIASQHPIIMLHHHGCSDAKRRGRRNARQTKQEQASSSQPALSRSSGWASAWINRSLAPHALGPWMNEVWQLTLQQSAQRPPNGRVCSYVHRVSFFDLPLFFFLLAGRSS